MQMLESLFDKLISQLSIGWLVYLAIILICVYYYLRRVGIKSEEEKNTLNKKAFIIIIAIIIFVVPYGSYLHFCSEEFEKFDNGIVGVLVLELEGDENKSLQNDIVSSLNSNLKGLQIEVKGFNESVTELNGIEDAHNRAKKIGRDANAKIVIWGNKIGKKKYHPRLTLITDTNQVYIPNERTLPPHQVDMIDLSSDFTEEPIYLAEFVAGYTNFRAKEYVRSISHFEKVASKFAIYSPENIYCNYFIAESYFELAETKERNKNINSAIMHLKKIVTYENPTRLKVKLS